MIQFTDDIANSNRGQFLIGVCTHMMAEKGFFHRGGPYQQRGDQNINGNRRDNGWNSKKDVCSKSMNSRRANSQRRVVPAMGMVTANK